MSNKMPKASDAKTKSAHRPKNKPLLILGVAASVVLVLGMLVLTILYWPYRANLSVNGHTYNLSVAKTNSQLEKGLGGRSSLPANQGMLFVFSGEATRCFWMKDMRFPLDMVWLNSGKQVVALLQNVTPATYPKAFCPVQPARYVIELNAGQASLADIKIGETLHF